MGVIFYGTFLSVSGGKNKWDKYFISFHTGSLREAKVYERVEVSDTPLRDFGNIGLGGRIS